jgi:hypothetical protein
MPVMYSATLFVHSSLRWIVIVLGLIVVLRAFAGWFGGRPWTASDEGASKWFTMVLDVQLLVGLLLYLGISPLTRAAFSDFGAAMGDRILRFWAVEHLFGMLIGVALVHIGRARARRAPAGPPRHRLTAIFVTLGLLVMLASIPWPGMAAGRPLLRWW